ncbi:DNA primase [Sphingorhabdus pulchriflava]|uniref:DNA primase n=1 Tax=Sphingorhabdus pulchriflava TaxID=2292257 RepID=A0A371BGC7_9SPHN|nr:CHC2 zinc finger domain-containing protein [Sphingorhabdus pulchriflava]RDV06411.1 DNA primase [Sphingorhabdus pulchriflava]
MTQQPDSRTRIDDIKRMNPIEEVIGKVTTLSKGQKPRGKCPLHGSNSASLAVDIKKQTATCYGCQWHGDVIGFVMAHQGLDFAGAVEHLGGAKPLAAESKTTRERNPFQRKPRNLIDSIDAGRWMWQHALPDEDAARRYFIGRGVPIPVLTAARVLPFRFLAECPLMAWEEGASPRSGLHNPALVALIRRPELVDGMLQFVPIGCHVTYLSPDGTGPMRRRMPWAKPDQDPWFPKRKMFGGSKGGCILLGEYWKSAPLFVGEGNETVLSGMALHDAVEDAVGVATLSLDTLQGRVKKWRGGIWPLFDIQPDPEAPPFVIEGHRGLVTGLIDSDMAPLKGPLDQRTGDFTGEPVVEIKGGPIVRRAITGAERARICGELIVKGWRTAGVHQVRAMRAATGMDFNDMTAKGVAA